mmetsp:Transcript_11630/g.36825  ORF Transcript_11630/g.36825 Transcript_11630/m.36825 type:complete len:637 (+) Transcript_11630:185-2095(+)
MKTRLKSIFNIGDRRDGERGGRPGSRAATPTAPAEPTSSKSEEFSLPALGRLKVNNEEPRGGGQGNSSAGRLPERARLRLTDSAKDNWKAVEGAVGEILEDVYAAADTANGSFKRDKGPRGDDLDHVHRRSLQERLQKRKSLPTGFAISDQLERSGSPQLPVGVGVGSPLSPHFRKQRDPWRQGTQSVGKPVSPPSSSRSSKSEGRKGTANVGRRAPVNVFASQLAHASASSTATSSPYPSPPSALRPSSSRPGASADCKGQKCLRANFTLAEKLGDGGFSTVLTAKENATGALFAAKLINLKGCTEKQLREVIAEAGLAMALRHPCIVDHKDVFVDKSTRECVFLMERMAGGSLQDHLMLHPRILASTKAAMVFKSLMGAVQHLHSRGVVHCDIKPDNILIQKMGDFSITKLSDFGLALYFNEEGIAILNRVRGTEGFIAPELYHSKRVPVESAATCDTPKGSLGRQMSIGSMMGAGRESDHTPKADGAINSPFHTKARGETRESASSSSSPSRTAPATRQEVLYTPAVDVWSAGVTLYSTLGGNWQKPIKQMSSWERDGVGSGPDKYLFENDSMWRRVWMTTTTTAAGEPALLVKNHREHREAVHLLRWMLDPDPLRRATVQECLDHPWTQRNF